MHQLDRIELMLQRLSTIEPPKQIELKKLFDALCADKKIEAIKEHRMISGLGLKESKDEIERLYQAMRHK